MSDGLSANTVVWVFTLASAYAAVQILTQLVDALVDLRVQEMSETPYPRRIIVARWSAVRMTLRLLMAADCLLLALWYASVRGDTTALGPGPQLRLFLAWWLEVFALIPILLAASGVCDWYYRRRYDRV